MNAAGRVRVINNEARAAGPPLVEYYVRVIQVGDEVGSEVCATADDGGAAELDEAAGIGVGEGFEEDLVHHGEDGGVGADSEGQC